TESKSFRTLKATPPDQAASPKISHSSSDRGLLHCELARVLDDDAQSLLAECHTANGADGSRNQAS
ncbi:hypothetical protein, partial [Bradyrhizobium liaoningense]|uniref:hypothetical protein n=1 Tax=Bradyrhizobium liaoningense TaxID=43992 RepID=UPI001BA7AE14